MNTRSLHPFLGLLTLFVASSLAGVAAQDAEDFIAGLSESERQAIGLNTMSAAQQAALERAVERYVAGRSEEAVVEATAEVRTELVGEINEREEQLAAAEQKLADVKAELERKTEEVEVAAAGEDTSLLQRARVLLTPGTKIEFATIHSRLTEPFRGWSDGTLFKLENGQVWQVSGGKKYWAPREEAGKAVSIEPGSFGSFFMRLEGVKSTPKVVLVSRN